MIQKIYKSFSIVAAILITFIVYSNVYAASIPVNCAKRYSDADKMNLVNDFKIDIDKNGNQYTITMNPKSKDATKQLEMQKVVFKVTKITPAAGNNDLIGKTLKAGVPLVLDIEGSTGIPEIGGEGAKIRLETNFTAKYCNKQVPGIVEVYATDYDTKPVVEEIDIKIDPSELQKAEQGNRIDCTDYKTKMNENTFDYKFCWAKHHAIHDKDKFERNKDKNSGYTMTNFTHAFDAKDDYKDLKYKDIVSDNMAEARQYVCNSKVSQKYEVAIQNDDNYYKDNTHYLYGSGTKTYSAGYYKYHFKSHNATNGKEAKCKVTCEEAVTVKYGPPVAQKAGACFQYKIKVESRVTCYMSKTPPPPEVYKTVCSPTPVCTGKTGKTHNQGGPEEEFDECIKSCDNGKYTNKCSNECYSKIYEDGSNELPLVAEVERTAKTMSAAEYASVSKEGNRSRDNINGYYYKSSGSVHWAPGGIKGRWYKHHSWGIEGHVYNVIKSGIPRTEVCTESCHWKDTCGDKEYFNFGLAEWDKKNNIEIYNTAINKCKAKATCTKSTAEFKISAQYKRLADTNGKTETVTINFPWENNPNSSDKLSTCREDDSKKVHTAGNSNTTILDYLDGCYSSTSCDIENHYLTEWSFPGAWTKKKTGEVSFDPTHGNDSTWRSRPQKFCIPKDAINVNKEWFRWYYVNKEGLTEGYICDFNKYKNGEGLPSEASTEYNIHGQAIHFGFFEWNMNFKCFYAVDSSYPEKIESGANAGSYKCHEDGETPDYKIRTVTNTQLFPGQSDAAVTGSTKEREPGYNWTSDAALTDKTVTEEYENNPAKVKEYVEEVNNTIYNSDDYVDYEFTLAPQQLRQIKIYNKEVDGFDKFCGKLTESEATPLSKGREVITITHYQSSLFRGGIDKDDTSSAWNTSCSNASSTNFLTGKKPQVRCNNNDKGTSCKVIK